MVVGYRYSADRAASPGTPSGSSVLKAIMVGAGMWMLLGGAVALAITVTLWIVTHPSEGLLFSPLVPFIGLVLLFKIAPIAAILGAWHGFWRAPNGAVVGVALGSLGVLFALPRSHVLPLQDCVICAVAAIGGGLWAGAVTARVMRRQGRSIPWTARRVASFAVLWTAVASLEGATIAREVFSRILPPELRLQDVNAIRAGSARGIARSGRYVFTWRDVVTHAREGCLASVIQHDGAVAIACPVTPWRAERRFDGAVNTDGRFRAGAVDTTYERADGGVYVRFHRLTGRFFGDSVLDVEMYEMDGPTNMGDDGDEPRLARGTGRRCPRDDASSCPDDETAP